MQILWLKELLHLILQLYFAFRTDFNLNDSNFELRIVNCLDCFSESLDEQALLILPSNPFICEATQAEVFKFPEPKDIFVEQIIGVGHVKSRGDDFKDLQGW